MTKALVHPKPAVPFLRRGNPTIVTVPDHVVVRWRGTLGHPHAPEARHRDDSVRSALSNECQPRPMPQSVRRVLLYLHRQELDRPCTSLARLAQVAGLSPSRFMHIFTESLGIPLRPYLLWLRVQRAAGALAAGQTVTEAAHVAGFADASHLTRTCRRMFGATPRELIGWTPSTGELQPSSGSERRWVTRELSHAVDLGEGTALSASSRRSAS
jgi:AraC-like DNA-binding protein